MFRTSSRFISIAGTLYSILLFSSCENDIRTIKLLTSPDKLPVETAIDVELMYSDSAKLKMKLKAPELDRFEGAENYIVLPKGVVLTFFDDTMKTKSVLTADYAKRDLDDGKMEARNNVVVVNERGDRLETEHLIWDEHRDPQIYTEANVVISTPTDTLRGRGLESNRDFTKYRILNPVGTSVVPEDSVNENDH